MVHSLLQEPSLFWYMVLVVLRLADLLSMYSTVSASTSKDNGTVLYTSGKELVQVARYAIRRIEVSNANKCRYLVRYRTIL